METQKIAKNQETSLMLMRFYSIHNHEKLPLVGACTSFW